jgi:hypothetical protein
MCLQVAQAQPSPVYKGDQAISEILNFIEGKATCKDSKKAAKKARQKEKKVCHPSSLVNKQKLFMVKRSFFTT